MKKILSVILMIIAVMTINVHAEGEAWPKEITSGDYSFTITGVELQIYEMFNEDDLIAAGETEEDAAATDSESKVKYASYEPVDNVILEADNFTTNPTVTTDKLGDLDTMFIKLNLDLNKEKIQNLIQDKIADTGEDGKYYIVDVVLYYKLNNFPNTFKTVHETDLVRVMLQADNDLTDLLEESIDTDPDFENVFVMDKIIIQKNASNEIEYDYVDTLREEDILIKVNSLSFYEKEDADKVTDKPDYKVIFHNFANIDALINAYKINPEPTPEDLPDNPITSTETNQVVNVADTGKTVPFLLYGISIALILAGAIVIIKVLNQPKKEV